MTEQEEFEKDFRKAREKYRELRQEQREKIVTFLKSKEFRVSNQKGQYPAGMGSTEYTNYGALEPSYDLSDWLWVKAKKDGADIWISLQALDQDVKSGNFHALMDRIALEIVPEGQKLVPAAQFSGDYTTNLELPLSADDLNELLQLIEKQIADIKASQK